MTTDTLDDKYERLRRILGDLKSVAVAFSAGVDSTFVLKAAIDALGPDNVVAVTGRSDSLAKAEFEEAVRLARALGVEHVTIDTDEFDNPDYVRNPIDRCYHCKTTLYTHLEKLIEHRGISAIVNGINADDRFDFRPGIQAAKEHAVHCPAAEAGLSKEDVRELSRRLGLPTSEKPASPCLSSRVPYGESVTPEKLRMIEAAEAFLHEMGIRECRVRHHQDLARIEVPLEWLPMLTHPEYAARIDEHFRALGYRHVTVDLRGFRSGSLNEVVQLDVLPIRA